MASPTLLTPTSKPNTPLYPIKPKCTTATATTITAVTTPTQKTKPQQRQNHLPRRQLLLVAAPIATTIATQIRPAHAATDEEYVKETEEVINKVRTTIALDKNDPNVAEAVADLRAISNSWVAKYRREKALLGRASFRDIYSALNAVSGHYISFGPTAPIPSKRKARILEEMDTAEKALLRGR